VASATLTRLGAWTAAAIFLIAVVSNFHLCFQFTHDCWIVLLAIDLLVAGLCWGRPLADWTKATAWGVFGGFCGMVNPAVALAWGLMTLIVGYRDRVWSRFGI